MFWWWLASRILHPAELPPGLFPSQRPEACRDAVIEVRPERFTFIQPDQWGANETIELI